MWWEGELLGGLGHFGLISSDKNSFKGVRGDKRMPSMSNGCAARETQAKNIQANIGSLGEPKGILIDALKCSRSKVRTTS